MKRIFLFLFLITSLISCYDVETLVNSIAEANIVTCESIGFAGSPSGVYKDFERLKRKASKEELIELTHHDSAAVVVYAAYALIDRELIEPDKLLYQFLDNRESVSTMCGCLFSSSTVPSQIYHRYWQSRYEFPNDDDYEKGVLHDSEDLLKMDSLILFSENRDWLLMTSALENREYSDVYLQRIKELAFDENDFVALKYVFKHLKEGNEDRLITAFDVYLANDLTDVEELFGPKGVIKDMRKELVKSLD